MTPTSVRTVPADDFAWSAPDGPAADLRRIADAAARADGAAALDEAALLSLRHQGLDGARLWLADSAGFLLASLTEGQAEVNLVVDPAHRGRGVGRALADAAREALVGRRVTAWSHGNHPAAAALAAELGVDQVRDLWVMRRSLREPLPDLTTPTAFVVRPFEPGRDEEAFLAVNAAAFADHPEQGSLTRAGLEQRMAEPWFDPAGFFLAVSTGSTGGTGSSGGADSSGEEGELLGFHWTKVHEEADPPHGEVYVVGVSPSAQGMGLGKVLTLTGLHHLASRGLDEVVLYVEADNRAAIAVYAGLGFTHAEEDTHVMYAGIL